MILNICENGSVLSVMRIVNLVVTLIKIIVPILLLVTSLITFMNSVKDGKGVKKPLNVLVNKAIAAVSIFLVPTIVKITINIISPGGDGYAACINNATPEMINLAFSSSADEALKNLKTNLNYTNYNEAKNEISKIKDESIKKQKETELNNLYQYIKVMDDINKLSSTYDKTSYENISKYIEEISDPEIKELLISKLESVGKGLLLNVEEGTYSGQEGLRYYVNVPEGVTSNMPLVMFLHGDGGNDNYAQHNPVYASAIKIYGGAYPFIIVAPVGGMWAETNGRISQLHEIMEKVCDEYQCDRDKLIITGHSRGSIGVWHFVDKYPNYFHAAIPVSCGSYAINGRNFVGTKVKAFAGTVSPEDRYASEMRSNVNKINNAGGYAEMIVLNGANHGTTPSLAYTQSTFDWMLE